MRTTITLLTILFSGMLLFSSCSEKVNTLTSQEKKDGWVLLFNGKDFTGWREYNSDVMAKNWIIEDNAMKVFTAEGKKSGQGGGGDIIYDRKFSNYELSVDWKADKMGNSGIFYNIREVPGERIYYASPEAQILDNENATDNKIDSHLAGSLYDMIPADPKTVNPAGEWNSFLLQVDNGKVTHTMNGVKLLEYELWSPQWDSLVQNSKFKDFPGFAEGISREGYIGLQDHGYAIWFRNIKLRELE